MNIYIVFGLLLASLGVLSSLLIRHERPIIHRLFRADFIFIITVFIFLFVSTVYYFDVHKSHLQDVTFEWLINNHIFMFSLYTVSLTLIVVSCTVHMLTTNKWKKLQDSIIFFIVLLLYILFHPFWEALIGKHIIDKFLSFLESSIINDIICVFIVFCFIIFTSYHKGKNIKHKTALICIIVILFWVYYRWFCNQCGPNNAHFRLYFEPLFINDHFKYIDFIPSIAFCGIISYIIEQSNIVWIEHIESYNDSIKLKASVISIKDTPIFDSHFDKLKRYSFAADVIQELSKIPASSGSYSFGIDSQWGGGKTSFLNLMKEYINSHYPYKENSIIIDFNPWLYAAEKDLITAFFDELSKYLKEYDSSLAKNIINYSKLLSAFDTRETKLIASLIDSTSIKDDNTLQKKKEQITNALRHFKKQIFVFVDDLDRLDADELMEMMKLIRNISDFPFMYFVAAYDRQYLVECLETRMKTKGTDFVEKIFQHEFHLPPIAIENLRSSLFEFIVATENFRNHSSDIIKLKLFIKNNDKDNPLNALSNLREVKRLAKHFCASYRCVVDEVNVIDLLLIELIKTKYPLVFSFFEKKNDAILKPIPETKRYELYTGNNDINHIDFINFIRHNRKEFKLSVIDRIFVETTFKILFTESSRYQGLQRINEIAWFNRYINLTELETDIPIEEFGEIIVKNISAINKAIDDWLSKHKSVSLRYRLLNHDAKDYDEQLKLISAALYFISNDKEIPHYNLDSLIHDLQRFTTKYTEKEKEKEKDYITETLVKYGNNSEIRKYVAHLFKTSRDQKQLLSTKEITIIQNKIFNEYINSPKVKSHDVFICFCELLNGEIHIGSFDNIENTNSCRELLQSMKNYIEKHIVDSIPEFLDTVVIYTTGQENDEYKLSRIIDIIWGKWIGHFYNYIYCLDNNHPIILEFKEFLRLYKKNGYKKIKFNFKHIRILD